MRRLGWEEIHTSELTCFVALKFEGALLSPTRGKKKVRIQFSPVAPSSDHFDIISCQQAACPLVSWGGPSHVIWLLEVCLGSGLGASLFSYR